MRRGLVIVGVVFVVLAAIGIGVGMYRAGEAHGVAQQITTTASAGTTADTEVVRVVDGYGYGWGHGGFFPFGFFLVPLLIVGTVLLVRAALWRGDARGRGGWGPGWFGPGGPGGTGFGGAREEWLAKAEAWHRAMHEGADPAKPDAPRPESSGGGHQTSA